MSRTPFTVGSVQTSRPASGMGGKPPMPDAGLRTYKKIPYSGADRLTDPVYGIFFNASGTYARYSFPQTPLAP